MLHVSLTDGRIGVYKYRRVHMRGRDHHHRHHHHHRHPHHHQAVNEFVDLDDATVVG